MKGVDAGKTLWSEGNIYLSISKYIFIFLPALVYFLYVFKYAANVPAWDDYEAILKFTLSYKDAHGLERFYLLFAQENEHRLALSKIVYVIYYAIANNINFRNLIFIGNIHLLLFFIILIVFIKKCLPRHWVIASFVLGLCIFDLNSWQNADFASSSMANYGVLFFFSLSLLLYQVNDRKFILPAVIFQICCTFAYGNGLIASGMLVLFTLLSRDRAKIISCGLTFVVFSSLYFLHFQLRRAAPFVKIPVMIGYFFHFLSAYIEEGHFRLPAVLGVVILVSFVLACPFDKKYLIKPQALPFFCILGFVLLSAIPASVLRSNVIEYIPSRYRIYTNLLPALLFIFLLIKFQREKIKTTIAVVYSSLVLLTYARDFKQGDHDFANLHHILINIDYFYDNKNLAKSVSEEACKAKIYCLDNYRQSMLVF